MAQIPSFFSRVASIAKNFLSKEKPIYSQKNEASDKVRYITDKFNKYKDYFQSDRERENDNWKMYHGMEFGQWDKDQVSKLMSEGRHAGQYNFIKKKINSLAGMLLRNWYDVDFVPVDGSYSDLTTLLKTLYYSDKEEMDWDLSYKLFCVDFLIFGGTEEMIISDRYDPLGNIGFERIQPGHILFDPEWTNDTGWDLKNAIKVAYMDADTIASKFNISNEEIKTQMEILKINGPSFDSTDFDSADLPQYNLNDMYAKQFKIIEDHYIKEEKNKAEFVFDSNGILTQVPDTFTDDEKRQWVITNQIDIGAGVIEKDILIKKYKICTVCPQLFISKPLEEKEALIQIGRLPFFHSSCGRVNGKDCGKVDDYKDIQQTINKREALIDDMIVNNAAGGKAIDPEIVGNDAGMVEELKANLNNPAYNFLSKSGEIASGRKHFEEIPRSQFPNDIVNELQRMWELSDRIGDVNANSDGRSEGSEDRSGILYARKQQQTEISLTVLTKALERHWNEKGEAYMLLAQSLYSGVYRQFKTPGEQGSIAINESIDTTQGTIIKNDIAKLPRHKVIISQSPQGISYREVQRTINSELLKYIPPQNPLSRAVAVANVMKSLDSSSEERKEYEIAANLEKQLAYASIQAQIASFQMQTQQIMNPQPPPGQSGQPGQPETPNQNQAVQPGQGPQGIPTVLPQK